jgi:hypothetical protein
MSQSEDAGRTQAATALLHAQRLERVEAIHAKLTSRITTLEEKALYIPDAEQADLLKEVLAFYKAKREFRERLSNSLIEKGITGLALFILTATFFYIKHVITEVS